MSAQVLRFPTAATKTDPEAAKAKPEMDPEPPNESCYYSDAQLHDILQTLIDAGHKYLAEIHLIACRDYWTSKNLK